MSYLLAGLQAANRPKANIYRAFGKTERAGWRSRQILEKDNGLEFEYGVVSGN